VFENRVLRRIFGPKRQEVIGGWRKLHNVELHNLLSSSNITRVGDMAIYGRVILKYINVRLWSALRWLRRWSQRGGGGIC
jgi:hypothetical protein